MSVERLYRGADSGCEHPREGSCIAYFLYMVPTSSHKAGKDFAVPMSPGHAKLMSAMHIHSGRHPLPTEHLSYPGLRRRKGSWTGRLTCERSPYSSRLDHEKLQVQALKVCTSHVQDTLNLNQMATRLPHVQGRSYLLGSSRVTRDSHTKVRLGDEDIFPKKIKLRMPGYKPEEEFRGSRGCGSLLGAKRQRYSSERCKSQERLGPRERMAQNVLLRPQDTLTCLTGMFLPQIFSFQHYSTWILAFKCKQSQGRSHSELINGNVGRELKTEAPSVLPRTEGKASV